MPYHVMMCEPLLSLSNGQDPTQIMFMIMSSFMMGKAHEGGERGEGGGVIPKSEARLRNCGSPHLRPHIVGLLPL